MREKKRKKKRLEKGKGKREEEKKEDKKEIRKRLPSKQSLLLLKYICFVISVFNGERRQHDGTEWFSPHILTF